MEDTTRAEAQSESKTVEPQAPAAEQNESILTALQTENDALKAQLAEATDASQRRDDQDCLLQDARTENRRLRRQLGAASVRDAVARAAEQVGIAPSMGRIHAHRFRCDIDAEGEVTVTPDPLEYFEAELRRDPRMRAAAKGFAVEQRAAAVADGAVDLDQADPAELLAALDRSVSRKTRFIARHGVQAYLALCDRVRRRDGQR